jgi:cytochrome d ubiquinol oxidase subunit I
MVTLSMIAIGTSLSAIWIITVNGFMHNPIGATWDGSKMILDNFATMVFNPYAWYMLIHNHLSAIMLAAFVLLAIASYHLKKETKYIEEFRYAAKLAAITVVVVGILIPITGNFYMNFINEVQPAKIEMISGVSSHHMNGLVNFSFLTMVSLGGIFIFLGVYTLIFFEKYIKSKTLQKIYMYLVPLPYIAITAGWIVTEVGRQPWVIYNVMKTKDAISNVPVEQVWFSLVSIFVFYVILYAMDYRLTIDRIKKGFVEEGESNE